ncbi:arginine--tRNA ligase [Mesobacillus subterraneus]|uniref:Arginine--tRNA ligase n=1 Tax=Mesobacillus subterraneus TaxID=285983 RepID=A0A3R9E3W4_9BACI|nr:arginine--tRNA ligase [Mesobacillus subterraneus]RSD25536.1 arginine--tRNA ligase [Mesobacillus subterraneus]
MNYVKDYAEKIASVLDGFMSSSEIEPIIEKPRFMNQGDLAFPCFQLAKVMKKSPVVIAEGLSKQLQDISGESFERIVSAGGYVNAFLNKSMTAKKVLKEILDKKEKYGDFDIGGNGIVTIDLSSPNIAKPFSMGHLRSTVIGNSLALIYKKSGYKPVKINHLGDWGTQFGKLIKAYKLWGSEETVKENPIKELLALYVKFHEEAGANPQLEQEGRDWFRRLENDDQEALQLWEWFREESLKEFKKIYDLMRVEFDSFAGEAFYNDKMDKIVELLEEKALLEESDCAQVVKLEKEDLPPCLIKKSDGATLYATRDLAAAKFRHDEYGFIKSLYIVGNEQTLHFKQLKAVLEKMDLTWAQDLVHIPFGMMLKDGKKMSTRKGKVILLEDVLNESIELARLNIEEKNPELATKEDTAKIVGVGAIIFHDLKNFRMNDIEFSLEDMLKVEGETGPYVQYTNARAQSLLRKAGELTVSCEGPINGISEWPVITELAEFPNAVKRAHEKNDPSQIAKYVLDLAQAFNKYYGEVRILEENEERLTRLAVVQSVSIVLEEGLRLLGIQSPKEM